MEASYKELNLASLRRAPLAGAQGPQAKIQENCMLRSSHYLNHVDSQEKTSHALQALDAAPPVLPSARHISVAALHSIQGLSSNK